MQEEFRYTYNAPRAYPIGSIILSFASLVWTACTYFSSDDISTALAITVGLFILTFLEYAVRWYKSTVHNGTTYSFTDEGIRIEKGATKRLLPWGSHKLYLSDFESFFGMISQYLPLSGFVLSDISKYSFHLYNSEDILAVAQSFVLPVMPEQVNTVESILQKHYKKGQPGFVKSKYLGALIVFLVLVILMLVLVFSVK